MLLTVAYCLATLLSGVLAISAHRLHRQIRVPYDGFNRFANAALVVFFAQATEIQFLKPDRGTPLGGSMTTGAYAVEVVAGLVVIGLWQSLTLTQMLSRIARR